MYESKSCRFIELRHTVGVASATAFVIRRLIRFTGVGGVIFRSWVPNLKFDENSARTDQKE